MSRFYLRFCWWCRNPLRVTWWVPFFPLFLSVWGGLLILKWLLMCLLWLFERFFYPETLPWVVFVWLQWCEATILFRCCTCSSDPTQLKSFFTSYFWDGWVVFFLMSVLLGFFSVVVWGVDRENGCLLVDIST